MASLICHLLVPIDRIFLVIIQAILVELFCQKTQNLEFERTTSWHETKYMKQFEFRIYYVSCYDNHLDNFVKAVEERSEYQKRQN